MSRTAVSIDGQSYKIARANLVPTGARQWQWSTRPSQPSDPSIPYEAIWEFSDPAFRSVEDITERRRLVPLGAFPGEDIAAGQGELGTHYTDGCDGRWFQRLSLGPLINVVTLSTNDPTFTESLLGQASAIADTTWFLDGSPVADNVTALVTAPGPTGTTYLYAPSGRFVRKLNLSDMSLINDTHVLAAAATSALLTYTQKSVPELSVGMDSQPYEVMNQVAVPPNRDNWVTNTASFISRIISQGAGEVVMLAGRTISRNILAGSVTMTSPNALVLDTIDGEKITFTGFALDGNLYVIGTDNGPYMLDSNELRFYPIMPELDANIENLRGMGNDFIIGTILPLASGARYQRGGFGSSFGPEVIDGNLTPVQGLPTAHAGWERWFYQHIYGTDGNTYLLAYDRKQKDPRTPAGFAPYVIANLGARRCDALLYVGTVNGLRARRTLIGGYGSDLYWMTIGNTRAEIDDTSYRFTASGVWYGTELRRFPHMLKDVTHVELETTGCISNTATRRTVTVGMRIIDDDGVSTVVPLTGSRAGENDTIKTNGFQQRFFVDDTGTPLPNVSGRRIRPQLTLATNDSTTSPTCEGRLRVHYRMRTIMTEVAAFWLVLDESDPVRNVATQLQDLEDLVEAGAVEVRDDIDGKNYFVKVETVTAQEAQERGGTSDSATTSVRLAHVQIARWPSVVD